MQNDISLLSEDIYRALLDGGFLVEDSLDEYAHIVHRRNSEVFFNNNKFQLTILPTLECNFKCWYCYEQHPQSKMSAETIERIKKYADYIINKYPIFHFHLDWFGGEPLLYFDEIVKPLSLYIQSACRKNNIHFSNTMTTNGYLIDQNRITDFEEIQLTSFQITLDGNKDIHNKTRFETRGDDSYTRIIRNINLICQHIKDACVTLRINYTNKNLVDLGHIADDINPDNRHKIGVSMQRVWQTRGTETEISEQQIETEIEYMRSRDLQVRHNATVYCTGMRCYADSVLQSVVNYDGSLFKCTARDFAKLTASVGYLNEEGAPIWNDNYFKHYLKPVFDNAKCKACVFLPVCLGTCSQKFIEDGEAAIDADCVPHEWEHGLKEELLQDLYNYITSAK